MNKFADQKKTCFYLGHLTENEAQQIIYNQFSMKLNIVNEMDKLPENSENTLRCVLNPSVKNVSPIIAINLFDIVIWRNLIDRTKEFINIEVIKWDVPSQNVIKWKHSIGDLAGYFCTKLPEGQISFNFVYTDDLTSDTLSLYQKLYASVVEDAKNNYTVNRLICFNESVNCLNKLFTALMLSFDLSQIMTNIKNKSINLDIFTELERYNMYANQRSCRSSEVFQKRYHKFIDIGK